MHGDCRSSRIRKELVIVITPIKRTLRSAIYINVEPRHLSLAFVNCVKSDDVTEWLNRAQRGSSHESPKRAETSTGCRVRRWKWPGDPFHDVFPLKKRWNDGRVDATQWGFAFTRNRWKIALKLRYRRDIQSESEQVP